jgi:hypothetical protein
MCGTLQGNMSIFSYCAVKFMTKIHTRFQLRIVVYIAMVAAFLYLFGQ